MEEQRELGGGKDRGDFCSRETVVQSRRGGKARHQGSGPGEHLPGEMG